MSSRGEIDPSRPAGVVLCGGLSKRMGRCKAWLPVGSETMLGRVVRLVASVAYPVIVVAADGQDLPPLPSDVLVLRDPVPNGGPLLGLTKGFEALPRSLEFAYATAVDSPLLVPAWIDRLAERIGDHDAIVPRFAGRAYPLNALYRPQKVLPLAQTLLRQDVSRLLDFVEAIPCLFVDAGEFSDIDPERKTLRNINRQEDYQSLLLELP